LLAQSPGTLPFDPEWLRHRASALRQRVLKEFWQPDLATFAQAVTFTDSGNVCPARVVASSAGHVLDSTLLLGADARPIRQSLIRRFAERDLLAGAGIRTKSTTA